MNRTDVLIVGAGPTGLTLACDLARRGVACRIVEKAPRPFIGSRAKGLSPRTLEVFDDLGVQGAITDGGLPFPPFRLYSGVELLWERSLEQMLGRAAAVSSEAVPYPRPWLIPQWRTERILRDRLSALGGRVETDTEARALAQDGAGVVVTLAHDGAEETLLARYVVGADGGRSSVRKSCGFSFEGHTDATENTLIGDVRATGLRGPACHILTQGGDMATRFSLWDLPQSEYFQFVVTLPAEATPELSLNAVRDLLARRSGRLDITLDELRWISRYRVQVRMVDRLRIGRVLLAGDAAHVHPPAGGQGLNTGVQDAYNLGWKLAAALQGEHAERLLDSYDEERLPVAAQVLALTSRLDRRGFGSAANATPPSLDQLDISYRSSSLSFDDHTVACQLKAGDRAPDARLPDGSRLFDCLRGPHFTLLGFGARRAPALAGVLVRHVERPLPGFGVSNGFVLIRPDGHVAALSSSLAAVRDYLASLGVAGAGRGREA
jgi:2-polyprenyl-6-methoxyphenol hydroxylase-like FAD-dependent oxidoreductase